jgi:DNA-binding transcriptional LysR family regulator
VVYDSTTQLLVALEEFRSRINSVHSELIGEFYVGFLENLVTHQDLLLQQILSAYVRAHPSLKLRMVVGSAREIDRAVEERRLHIGISVKAEGSDKVVSVPLLTEISYLYCGREHALFNLEDPEISDELLSRCALVQHGYSTAESRLITQLHLNPQAISHQSEGILFLVLAGWHIGFLPAHYAKSWVAADAIRAIRTADVKKETHLAIKAQRASLDNPMVESFLSIARKLKEN